LTTQNKRLKEKLKRNDVRLEKDMLAVKFHPAFPTNKRKEFEDIVRTFMMGANNSATEASSMGTTHSNFAKYPKSENYGSSEDDSQNTFSHSTVDSLPLDSGFQSMSKSGPSSAFYTNRLRLEQKFGSQQPNVKDHDVESFLRNIPQGFHTAALTEKEKKKIVVRRLEELFIGKRGIIPGEHSQPMQQQEVSNSAAQHDREHGSSLSLKEGIREAQILPYDMDVDATGPGKLSSDSNSDSEIMSKRNLGCVNDGLSSPGQRPTRPIDLDPDRAQIPADNFDYIRHLGLPTPQLIQQDSADVEADIEGWIYLNLLINLAQLHIINVTSDFVRTAVADVSDRFQISPDGQKLRWRGGTDGTRLSSESGFSSLHQSPQDSDSLDEVGRKKRKAHAGRFATLPIENSLFTVPVRGRRKESPHYRPMFNHRTTSSSSSSLSSDVSGDIEAMKSSMSRVHVRDSGFKPRAKRCRNGGPILFYSGAQFFTDLSGDRTFLTHPHINEVAFDNHNEFILGSDLSKTTSIPRTDSGSSLARPFRDFANLPPFSKSSEQSDKDDDEMDLDFSPEWSFDESSPIKYPLPFIASGIDGTQLADHFSVEVETVRTVSKGESQPAPSKLFSSPGSLNSSRRRSVSHLLPVKTLYTKIQLSKLDPSPLPAPAGYYSARTSSSGTGSTPSMIGESILHRDPPPPLSSFQSKAPVELEQDSGEMEEDEDDDDDDDDYDYDNESIDMLAIERLQDPTIASREAEFDRLTREDRPCTRSG
jgi:hypothetical protein